MPAGQTEPIPVCLLVDGRTVRKWEHDAIERMVAETSAEVAVVVSDQRERDRSTLELLGRALELREWAAVSLVRSLFADPFPRCGEIRLDEQPYAADAEWIECDPETVDEWKTAIPTSTVRRVRDVSDVAVRLGFGVLTGDVLTDLDHGVLSFHHGDIREYRGQPAGCWEFIHGEDEVGITLQRLTERLDAGEVVVSKSVPIDDAETYSEVRGQLYDGSEDVLATAISKLEDGRTEFETVDDLGRMYSFPSGRAAFRFLVEEVRGYARRRLGRSVGV